MQPTIPETTPSTYDPITPPVLDRYELKYTIPVDLVDPISRFIRPYCEPDRYSAMCHDGFYTINSLYFDTPRYLFLRTRLTNADSRFNMRVRTYGNDLSAETGKEFTRKTKFIESVRGAHIGKP